ncbi:MAG TPA: DUF2062 domain-containing protein [Terracidiphilus sp.]|jgi:uncharacterized protein (DUF2062 family)|nr:DUF2062 domain-containing protein [Terracidiphilus sp.]
MTAASIRDRAAHWLSQDISPRRLALTLALGFAIGCLPVIGIPTLLCAGLALALRLNLPAMQAANYIAMPLQLALIVPFVRLGGWILSHAPGPTTAQSPLFHTAAQSAVQSAVLAGHALTGWFLIAVPAVLLLFAPLTLVLRRIPALAPVQSGD